MNARLRDQGPFSRIFIQPAAGDAGTSLGAAAWVDARERGVASPFEMTHAYLGPGFTDERIRRALENAKLPYATPTDIATATADLLAKDQIVGWFQGRMEFGPRSLGARSILASPTDPDMKDRLNAIKAREEFRPVAPAVLEEHAAEYFEPAEHSPFMLFVSAVKPETADRIPAVRHEDGTARIQTVSERDAPLFHRTIRSFMERTGTPVVVNTSFNTRGRPIVCTPEDALECFYATPLDALAIGSYLLTKT
jgi:carbamoyltransferase